MNLRESSLSIRWFGRRNFLEKDTYLRRNQQNLKTKVTQS